MPDFTSFKHPVLAVGCPTCDAGVGVWCRRPSRHRAADLHRTRRIEADRLFIEQHGEYAAISRSSAGWIIDPRGRVRD